MAILTWAGQGAALPPEPPAQPVRIKVSSQVRPDCPNAPAVERALSPLLRKEGLDKTAPPLLVHIIDEGASYRVVLRGAERRFVEEARNCEERARAAAVFAAMILVPPLLEGPPPQRSTQPAPGPGPERPRRFWIALEARGAVTLAPPASRMSAAPLLLGGGLQLALWASVSRRWSLGGVVSGSVGSPLLPLPLYSGGNVEILRSPLVLAGRTQIHVLPRLALSVDLGLGVALLQVTPGDLPSAETAGESLRPELLLALGFRGQVQLWPRWFLSLWTEVHGVPRPYELHIEPVGLVGRSPDVWLCFGLGVGYAIW